MMDSGYGGQEELASGAGLQGENRIVLLPAEDGRGGLLPRKDVRRKIVWERLK